MTPIFVYGTLRLGGSLQAGWLPESEFQFRPATLRGASMFHSAYGPYPVVRLGDGPGKVRGDIIVPSRDGDPKVEAHLAEMADMEIKAGYHRAVVEVEDDETGDLVEATVFAWSHPEAGAPVWSGDWIKALQDPARTCKREKAAQAPQKGTEPTEASAQTERVTLVTMPPSRWLVEIDGVLIPDSECKNGTDLSRWLKARNLKVNDTRHES